MTQQGTIKKLLPNGLAEVEVTRRSACGIEDVVNKLAGKIDEKTMTKLNYKVDELGESPETVAHDFLVEQKLIN